MAKSIVSSVAGTILHVELCDIVGKNSMSDMLFAELEQVLCEAQQDSAVRVVLLSGEGDVFSAGGDLRNFQEGPFPEGYIRSAFARLLARLLNFEKPIVAAVHGAAIGGASTLLLHCDFVLAASDTRFHLPFTQLGITPEFGSSYLLTLCGGYRMASELVLLAQPFDAEKAARAGIVNQVVPKDRLMEVALSYAERLAELPPRALRASKRLLKRAHHAALLSTFDAEGKELEVGFASAELQESIFAFFEKRKPDFSRFS